jgi:hypothetical protein
MYYDLIQYRHASVIQIQYIISYCCITMNVIHNPISYYKLIPSIHKVHSFINLVKLVKD